MTEDEPKGVFRQLRIDVEIRMARRRVRHALMPPAAPLAHRNGDLKKPAVLSPGEAEVLDALTPAFVLKPRPELARRVLTEARARGIDGRKLYDLLEQTRPDHWQPMPTWGDVAPEGDAPCP
jgi:hypothetical protein